MVNKNETKEKIRAGEFTIGFRMDFASPFIVEVLGKTGYDFVYFDCEHGAMGEHACEDMIRAAELVGLTPLVRVPSAEPSVIGHYLDSGAMGVIIPHCHSKEIAEAAIRASKYPPQGERGIGGRSLTLTDMSITDYLTRANEEIIVIGMIEDAQALKNLSEILTVEGLDVLFVGRLDLSISVGIPGQFSHPTIQEAISRVIREGRAAGKAVGVGALAVDEPSTVKSFIDGGAQFFSMNTTSILSSAARALLSRILNG